MASDSEHQAKFRKRRREAGFRKLSLYLDPEEAALLERVKAQHGGTDKAAVAALLRMVTGR